MIEGEIDSLMNQRVMLEDFLSKLGAMRTPDEAYALLSEKPEPKIIEPKSLET